MILKKADILTPINGLGYFMVMKVKTSSIIVSPIFGHEKLVYIEYPIITIKSYYKVLKDDLHNLHPIIKARFDHEKIRRLNKL